MKLGGAFWLRAPRVNGQATAAVSDHQLIGKQRAHANLPRLPLTPRAAKIIVPYGVILVPSYSFSSLRYPIGKRNHLIAFFKQ
jgi:hypothetical protein